MAFGEEAGYIDPVEANRSVSMKANVGGIDRMLRIVLGLGLIGAAVAGVIGPWGWLGVIPLATGIFRFCPAYLPFGASTCKPG